jgi:hypothetical protein
MKLSIRQRLALAFLASAWFVLGWGTPVARGGVAVTMSYPPVASPCESLSVTTLVVNTGATLSQLQVSESLPGGASYQYVTNSLQISVGGVVVFTNEASVLTLTNGTNLVFNLSSLQSASQNTNLLITQVFPGAAANQSWIQIYNPSANPIATAGWTIQNDRPGVTDSIPDITIAPGTFAVLAGDTNFFQSAYPGVANQVIQLSDNFAGNGLGQYADGLQLYNPNGDLADQLSWGFDTTLMNPSVPFVTTSTASLARVPANVDTGRSSDWVQLNVPAPDSGTVQTGVANGTAITITYQLTSQCGGVGGYFNTTTSYQQPPGSAPQTSAIKNYLPF